MWGVFSPMGKRARQIWLDGTRVEGLGSAMVFKRIFAAVVVSSPIAASPLIAAENWTDFRGADGDGVIKEKVGVPLEWSEKENIVWKTEVKGRAWSSPVVWGKQVWVTNATEDGKKMSAVCLDRDTGKVVYDLLLFENENPEPLGNKVNGYGSCSPTIDVECSDEYAAAIIHAHISNEPCVINGNVANHDLVTNLPGGCCVEVPCLVDHSGIQPTRVGELPPQLVALMQTNINVQALTVEALVTGKKEHVYHAAMLDPHTAAELSLDQIWNLVDDLLAAHSDWLPALS